MNVLVFITTILLSEFLKNAGEQNVYKFLMKIVENLRSSSFERRDRETLSVTSFNTSLQLFSLKPYKYFTHLPFYKIPIVVSNNVEGYIKYLFMDTL